MDVWRVSWIAVQVNSENRFQISVVFGVFNFEQIRLNKLIGHPLESTGQIVGLVIEIFLILKKQNFTCKEKRIILADQNMFRLNIQHVDKP